MSTDAQPAPATNTRSIDELPYSLVLELTVDDQDTIAELVRHADGEEREQFAARALRIGVLALRQARGAIDGDAVRREGERLIDTLQGALDTHATRLNDRIASELTRYFDPEGGHLQERLDRLLKKDGELEATLLRHVGGEDSALCKTLASHFGGDSPLMRMLDPDQSKGLLAILRETVEQQLEAQRDHVLKQFSLDNNEGALSRFIGELTRREAEVTKGLQGKIDEVVREFSLDEENSALSRLVRNVEEAQKTITAEFSLDGEDSALSRLKRLLEATNKSIDSQLSLDDEESALARLSRELRKVLDDQSETNRKFQEEVKTTLQAMAVRRAEAERSTRHGVEFEEAVFQQVQKESQQVNDVAESTGNTTGLIKLCKVGDVVVKLGPESAAPNARVVIEAKQKEGYTLTEAREEIEQARKNRDAQVGLFVFSKRTAPSGLEPLLRYGQDVFVIWDVDDITSDLYLNTGLTLARALCVRTHAERESQPVDFTAIDAAILEIEKRANGFEEIQTWTETIKSNGDKILDKIRTARKALEQQVVVLRDKMTELRRLLAGDGGA